MRMRKDDIRYYRSKLRIDKYNLDEELIEQPGLYYEVSEIVTRLIAERDTLKDELSTVDSEISLAIRRKASNSDEKLTEKALMEQVSLDGMHKSVQRNLFDKQKELNKWSVLKTGFEQRSEAIKHLVRLYVANYFTTDSGKLDDVARKVVSDSVRQKSSRKRLG